MYNKLLCLDTWIAPTRSRSSKLTFVEAHTIPSTIFHYTCDETLSSRFNALSIVVGWNFVGSFRFCTNLMGVGQVILKDNNMCNVK